METGRYADLNLSRLMLGTVQFGLPYGVANRTGQPSYADVRAIVAAAIEGGVTGFDTAAAYGNSEEVLGRALHELGVADRVVVVTKVRWLTPGEMDDDALAARAIEQSVAESQRRLKLDCLPVVLFHRECEARHLDVLERLKAKGRLQQVGVSCDNRPGPAAEFAALPAVSALQIPASIMDRRHLRGGSLAAAAAHGVAVLVRSVYLQGLLVMAEEAIPSGLRDVIPVRRRLAAIAGEAGMGLAELAVRYMLAQAGVTSVLTGVETVAQIHANVALFSRGPLAADMLAALDAAVPELPESILTPSLWPALLAPEKSTRQ
jgi:aryl-alcohol dehydrogenase-like predicted oxidoreductase